MHSVRTRVVMLAVFAVVALAGGCESNDYSPVVTMQAMTDSHLAPYPGAVLLHSGSSPRRSSIENGTIGAYAIRVFGANATLREVGRYYQSQLTPLGWTGGPGVWDKDGWEFSIQERPKSDWPETDLNYQIIYSEVLTQNTSWPGTSPGSASP